MEQKPDGIGLRPGDALVLAGTPGAAFAHDLVLPAGATVISKATEATREAYSAFAGTDLDERLRRAAASSCAVRFRSNLSGANPGATRTASCVRS